MTYNQDAYKPVIPSSSNDSEYNNDNIKYYNVNNYKQVSPNIIN